MTDRPTLVVFGAYSPCIIICFNYWNNAKTRVEWAKQRQTLLRSSHTILLKSIVSKHSTHLEDSFLMSKWSCKIEFIKPCDMHRTSTVSCSSNLGSAKSKFLGFSIIADLATPIGRLECVVSLMIKRPQRNSVLPFLPFSLMVFTIHNIYQGPWFEYCSFLQIHFFPFSTNITWLSDFQGWQT